MKVIKVFIGESENTNSVFVKGLAVVKDDSSITEDPWNTVMNILRTTNKNSGTSGDGFLRLGVGKLNVNKLG